ncbi:hypothetical protein MC885_015544 [Smutsia gigantea]|nr:hypothetical protein MC885_015544 [Smutsia gigantea]
MRFCPTPCPGETFWCFMSEQPMSISSCKNVTHCTPEDTACKTTLVQVESECPFSQSPMVTHSCSSSCQATDPDRIRAAHPVYCCFHDLCKSAGTAGLGAGALATLAAALLSHFLP